MYSTREELLNNLFSFKDERRAAFNCRICGGARKHLGVTLADLRAIAKREATENLYGFLSVLGDDYYEEAMLRGLAIAYAKIPFDEKEKALFGYITYIDNWALVDSSAATLKIKDADKKQYLKLVERLIADGREFAVRYAFVILLDYYVAEEYLDYIFTICDNTPADKYNVSMAVAWLISVCAAHYPEQTENYLKRAKIDDFTYNRAVDKICDSFRTDKQYKERLKQTKRIIKKN